MNREMAEKLYKYMDLNVDDIEDDIEHDYLVESSGTDGNTYLWYLDTIAEGAIRISDGKIITSPRVTAKLFGAEEEKVKFQFEASPDGNVLWGKAEDGLRITAEIAVPVGASEDYGYLTLRKAIQDEIVKKELYINAVFPYDGQEQFLADDATADAVVDIDVCD